MKETRLKRLYILKKTIYDAIPKTVWRMHREDNSSVVSQWWNGKRGSITKEEGVGSFSECIWNFSLDYGSNGLLVIQTYALVEPHKRIHRIQCYYMYTYKLIRK
jgi:hypothetical protein